MLKVYFAIVEANTSVYCKMDMFELSFWHPRQALTHKNWMFGEN